MDNISQIVTLVFFQRSIKFDQLYKHTAEFLSFHVLRYIGWLALYSGLQYTSNDMKCNKNYNKTSNFILHILHVERDYEFSMF